MSLDDVRSEHEVDGERQVPAVAPWRRGLPQADCSACSRTCVAVTLDADGRCADCQVEPPPRVAPEPVDPQLELTV